MHPVKEDVEFPASSSFRYSLGGCFLRSVHKFLQILKSNWSAYFYHAKNKIERKTNGIAA